MLHPGGPRMLSPTATAPACPTPAEEIAEAIDRVGPLARPALRRPALAGPPWRGGRRRAGNILFEEGAPADRMILILKGEIHVRRQHGGPMALFIGRAGQMTGFLPFSRMKISRRPGLCVSRRSGPC